MTTRIRLKQYARTAVVPDIVPMIPAPQYGKRGSAAAHDDTAKEEGGEPDPLIQTVNTIRDDLTSILHSIDVTKRSLGDDDDTGSMGAGSTAAAQSLSSAFLPKLDADLNKVKADLRGVAAGAERLRKKARLMANSLAVLEGSGVVGECEDGERGFWRRWRGLRWCCRRWGGCGRRRGRREGCRGGWEMGSHGGLVSVCSFGNLEVQME